jgi:hypothetical protein
MRVNLLFYIKPGVFVWPSSEIYENTDPYWLQQNSPALEDVELGESVWVFTREPEDDTYLLDSQIVVGAKGSSPDGSWGRLEVEGDMDESVLFDLDSQPDLEPLIRKLSIKTDALRLCHSFQGGGAVRRLSEDDHRQLLAWSTQLSLRDPAAAVAANMGEEPTAGGGEEGASIMVMARRYERSPANRRACIALKGYRCSVCGLDFGEMYGKVGDGFIHVHHLKPLSAPKQGHAVDPETDLVPICPNCHAMLHRKNPPYSPALLQRVILNQEEIHEA